MGKTKTIPNEEVIAKYRDWRSQWKPKPEWVDDEITFYVSKLAEFISPLPLSKVTKAVMHDFYHEEMVRIMRDKKSGEVRWPTDKLMGAWIQFDAFLADLRTRRV